MAVTMPTQIINFKMLFFTIVAVIYKEPRNNERPNQYKGEMWLKTKSYGELIDKG